MSTERNWVVVAWVEETSRFNPRTREHEETREGRACVWLRRGTTADVTKAQAHVDAEVPNGKVFVFPTTEREPLRRARREVMA